MSRDLVRRALEFAGPDRVPRQLSVLPWAEEHQPEAAARLRADYPDDIVAAPALYLEALPVVGDRWRKGVYIDEWGCRFENARDGQLGIVSQPLVCDWDDLARFRTPECTLHVDREAVDAFCASTDRFVLAPALIRPFERLCFIRGMEQALVDVEMQPAGFVELMRRIHEHCLREAEAWAATQVDAIELMDDWGGARRMLISPATWRRTFKPLYREYCEIARRAGKYVFMHSDGFITEIIPDLVEVGVQALNCELASMGVAELGRRFRGQVAFWGDSSLQQLLSSGSIEDVTDAVRDARQLLATSGGVVAYCELGRDARPENVGAALRAWQEVKL
jgi:uroporphyrinogen decarboxylase